MPNFTTEQEALFYCYALNEKQKEKIDEFHQILNESGVSEIIDSSVTEHTVGRRSEKPIHI